VIEDITKQLWRVLWTIVYISLQSRNEMLLSEIWWWWWWWCWWRCL